MRYVAGPRFFREATDDFPKDLRSPDDRLRIRKVRSRMLGIFAWQIGVAVRVKQLLHRPGRTISAPAIGAGKMHHRRIGPGWFTVLGLAIAVLGAIVFLFSDTLLGDTDVAYNLMFLGSILFLTGILIAVIGIFELIFGVIKGWITGR